MQREGGGRLGDILVQAGVVKERDLVDALAEFLGMVVADLRRFKPDAEALALVPEELARQHLVVPISLDDAGLRVAVAEPSDELRALLAEKTKSQVILMLAPLSDIRWAIDDNYQALGGVAQLVQAFEVVEGSTEEADRSIGVGRGRLRTHPSSRSSTASSPRPSATAPPTSTSSRSDDVVRVRFRIDGALKEVLVLPASWVSGLVSRIKIMAGMNIVERRRPQDGQLTTTIDGKDVDVRVATASTIWGEKLRHASPRQDPIGLPARRPRHAGRHPRDVLEDRPRSVRHGAVRRSDGQREDDDALRHAERGQQPDAQRHDDRGPGRVRLPVDQPDPDQRAGRDSPSPPG